MMPLTRTKGFFWRMINRNQDGLFLEYFLGAKEIKQREDWFLIKVYWLVILRSIFTLCASFPNINQLSVDDGDNQIYYLISDDHCFRRRCWNFSL